MSDSPFMLATAVAVIYIFLRFIEMRFILKETKPLKTLIRDGLLVYLSLLLGFYIIQNITPVIQLKKQPTEVFTDEPDF